MATHLTRRSSGWTYQRRVPKHLVKTLGVVVRAPLGRVSAHVAREHARLLSVRLDALWSAENVTEDGVEGIRPEIRDLVSRLQNAVAKNRGKMQLTIDALNEVKQRHLTVADERDAKAKENGALAKEGKRLKAAVEALSDGRDPPEPLPLFSIEAERVIAAKIKAAKATSTYPNKLKTAGRAWMMVIGDLEVDEYTPSQIQDFANLLQALPRDWAITPRYKDMTYAEVVADADAVDAKAIAAEQIPPKRFSQTNIKEYVAQVIHILHNIRAKFPKQVHDFQKAPRTIPKEARRPKARGSVEIEGLNEWLKEACKAKRPEDRYLPLLGLLTGARLGELVYLKKGDVKELFSQLCIDLMDDRDGTLETDPARPLKTEVSRRRIVLHEIVRDTHFPAYVASLPDDSWMWPRLHFRNAKTKVVKPHGAASKRMIRMMKSVGIHEPYSTVFHSLRHGAKDWHQDVKVDDRTSRMQVGHAFADVDQSYGSKSLRSIEFARLATLPLPEGLDLSPYLRPVDEHGFRQP